MKNPILPRFALLAHVGKSFLLLVIVLACGGVFVRGVMFASRMFLSVAVVVASPSLRDTLWIRCDFTFEFADSSHYLIAVDDFAFFG